MKRLPIVFFLFLNALMYNTYSTRMKPCLDRPNPIPVSDSPPAFHPNYPCCLFRLNVPGAPTYLKTITELEQQRVLQEIAQAVQQCKTSRR